LVGISGGEAIVELEEALAGGGEEGGSNGLEDCAAGAAPFSGGGPVGGSNGFDMMLYTRWNAIAKMTTEWT
jgi:hypothetical protein